MEKRYYIDTCIWINLWQRETSGKQKLWRFAKNFLERADEENATIYYSGFILKEMMFILSKEIFVKKRAFFDANCTKATLTNEEYEEGRKLESQLNGEIGFYDILHILLSRKIGAILITRDKKLLEVANKLGVEARKPEEIL